MAVLTRLRQRNFGLGARIVGVVIITTAVTLGVAALVLLPRLEHSLRDAALKTLETEVVAAQRDGAFAGLEKVPYYRLTASVPATGKTRADRQAQKIAQQLSADETSLGERLGATSVQLIGYIDEQGVGRPVVPVLTGNSATAAESAAVAVSGAPFDDAARAFLARRTIYSFGHGGNPEVRAAVWIPGLRDGVLVVRKSINEIPAAVATVRRSFEIAVIPGMLLTLLLAIPLAATLVRRLGQLREAALRLAIDGAGADLPFDRTHDEVGDLARSFAIVQRRLRQQEEARRAFVATASHELRTPLASLEGMLELLAEDLQADQVDLEDAAALLDRARAQSRRLARLAGDLLDLSRIDADVRLRSEPVELTELGRAVLAEFELRAMERGVVAILDDDGAVWALADPGSVARILRILLDNALRVAPTGGEVTVSVTAEPVPTLNVIDQGPGIAPEERGLIFERFKRGRDTGGEAGFGLGLAIGRELAERMGGSLVLGDREPPGATFTLALRPAAAPSPEPQASAAGV